MTLKEFKFWLEGYENSFINSAPSADQWEKIKNKFDEIEKEKFSPLLKRVGCINDSGSFGGNGHAS